jgi:hypothetical protein
MTRTGPVTIDELLDGLEFHWTRLPDVAARFSDWDDLERLDFIMEWPLQEDDLQSLSELIAAGSPTAEQRRRFHDLLRVVERNRPFLDRLLDRGMNPIGHSRPTLARES